MTKEVKCTICKEWLHGMDTLTLDFDKQTYCLLCISRYATLKEKSEK